MEGARAEDISEELLAAQSELSDVERKLEPLIKRRRVLLQLTRELEEKLKHCQSSSSKLANETAVDWSGKSFLWTDNIEKCLKNVFHFDEFRTLQRETINATLSGKDCLLIMPTGAGKSICFQLPAILFDGFSLVISPLVSLIQDQIIGLRKFGVSASVLTASTSKQETKEVYAQMTSKKPTMKMLYLTPEKVAKSKMLMNKLERAYGAKNLSRIIIDEVHCTSQWGHDFRPDFKILGVLKRQFPTVPILGLTATATDSVVNDVKNILWLKHDCVVFKSSFNRPNLFYEVRTPSPTATSQMDELANIIQVEFKQQSGIVYCFSRKDAETVTIELQKRGVRAGCYHAELDVEMKAANHQKWITDEIQVIIATIAFGMGIDKPNVRFVIHYSISKSIQNYYQESGRAGRDGIPAKCIIFFKFLDIFRQSCMVFTEQCGLDNLHAMLEYCIDLKKCRRSLIGHHFGEDWARKDCKDMCDNCLRLKSKCKLVVKDISHDAKDLYQILDQAKSREERLTPSKLINAWTGKGKVSSRVSGINSLGLSRGVCEKIISKLILDRALSEDFHYTPYSTICYLVAGYRHSLILQGRSSIEIFLEEPSTEEGCSEGEASHEAFDQEGEADDRSMLDRKRKIKVDKSVSNKKFHSGSNQESAKWGNSRAITEVVDLSD